MYCDYKIYNCYSIIWKRHDQNGIKSGPVQNWSGPGPNKSNSRKVPFQMKLRYGVSTFVKGENEILISKSD